MKIPFRKWTGMMLIMALIAGFMPIMPAEVSAAEPVTIISPVQGDTLTKSPINIVATVSSDNMSRITEMYYRVENLTTKLDTGIIKTKSAQKTGQYEITFSGVDLTEGKNRITVVVGETDTIVSKPITVDFTPVTNITDLRLDSMLFENNRILPESQLESFMITGTAGGASMVSAFVNGAPNPYYGNIRNDGFFYFLVEDANTPLSRSMSEFRLKPGDNDITFMALNGTQTYSTKRHVIYDNGKPFAFNVQMRETGAATTAPNIKLDGTSPFSPAQKATTVDLSAQLKFDTVSTAVYGRVFVNGVQSGPDITPSSLIENASWSKSSNYKVYDYALNKIVLTTDRYQTIDIWMYDKIKGEQHNQFTFEYIPQDVALVDQVYRVVDTSQLILNDVVKGTNNITQIPLKIFVKTKNAKGIVVNIGNTALLPSKITQTGAVNDLLFEVDLSGLSDGLNTVEIIPVDAGNSQVLSSQRDYEINVSSVPFVVMENVYNGMVVDKALGLNWPIKGKVINLGAGEAKIKINNGVFTALTVATDGTFSYTPAPSFVPGKNTINIQLFQNGYMVTENNYEVFHFSNATPEFAEIALLPGNPLAVNKFIETALKGTYATNEKYVKLSGAFSAGVQSVKLTVKVTDVNGKLTASSDMYTIGSNGHVVSGVNAVTDTTTTNKALYYMASANGGIIPSNPATPTTAGGFETYFVTLPTQGTAVLEFEIKNIDGVAATKTITIIREPLPYEIISPTVTQNSKKEDQINVNSNFVDIVIRAEGADSVVFGKDLAIQNAKSPDEFKYTVENLGMGKNTSLKFTVNRGKVKLPGTLNIYNAGTAIVGAQYKAKLASKMSAFSGKVELTFPKDTLLMRTKPFLSNSFLTKDRQILFGIADEIDGRVDKTQHQIPSDSNDSSNQTYYNMVPYSTGKMMLDEPTKRFRPASEKFWIDAGVMNTSSITSISKDKLQEFLNGRGMDPYGSSMMSSMYSPSDIFYNRVNTAAEVIPSNPGVLTLKYDGDIRNDAWRYLTIVHFEYYADYTGASGYRWRNIGGVVNLSKKTISVPVTTFGYYQVMYMDRSFDDVISHPWAQNQLDTLYAKGIMNKKASKFQTFEPYDPITRGEFVTMLVKIFEIKLDFEGTGTFEDVSVFRDKMESDGLYEYKYIETAARKGIVRGTTGGAFWPNNSITREDAAVMIAKAANLKLSTSDTKSLTTLQKSFTDANLITSYARTSVEAVVKAKLMSGMENSLITGSKVSYRYAPKDTFSRAEAAAVAINVMASQKKIPKQ